MVNAIEVSKWFIANNSQAASATRLGHVKLQKLLYYAKAMYYAVHDKQLFPEKVEAWENGPVVKDAYVAYRHESLAENHRDSDCPEFEDDIEKVLKVVNHLYGYQTPNSLIDLSHEEMPWKELESEVAERKNPIIKDERIKEYYKPLKDLYLTIDDEEIENTAFVNINGNVFSYDKRYVSLTSEDKVMLNAYGEEIKDHSYVVDKDAEIGLVVY